MAFKLNCDRCDRFIRNVSADQLRDMISTKKETICKECQATEAALQRFVEATRGKAQREFERLAGRYSELIREEIAKVVKGQ